MKTCTHCNENKNENDYYIKNKVLNIKATQCKACVSKLRKIYYKNNKVPILENRKIYYENNKNIILNNVFIYRENHKQDINIKAKVYRKNNEENISKIQKEYYIKNIESRREYNKIYREKHKKELFIKKLAYEKEKLKTNPSFKLKKAVSRAVAFALKKQNITKNKSIVNYLQYTVEELRQHLESLFEPWMNWNNHGVYNPKTWNDDDQSTWIWNIDHIIPQSDLLYSSMEDENFKKCWALKNLRPLSAKQNIIDGVKRIRHKNKEIKWQKNRQ